MLRVLSRKEKFFKGSSRFRLSVTAVLVMVTMVSGERLVVVVTVEGDSGLSF